MWYYKCVFAHVSSPRVFYRCVCLCLSLSVSVGLCLSLSVSVCFSLALCFRVFLCVSVCFCVFMCVSVCHIHIVCMQYCARCMFFGIHMDAHALQRPKSFQRIMHHCIMARGFQPKDRLANWAQCHRPWHRQRDWFATYAILPVSCPCQGNGRLVDGTEVSTRGH